jgi:hypothetical protein
MALNLFTKTHYAYQAGTSASSRSSPPPEFLICEQDTTKARRFIDDIREKAGAELAARVQVVETGRA